MCGKGIAEREGIVQYYMASKGRIIGFRFEEQRERSVTQSWRYRAYLERAIFQEHLEKRLNQHLVIFQGTSWEENFLTALSTAGSQRIRGPFYVVHTAQTLLDKEQRLWRRVESESG